MKERPSKSAQKREALTIRALGDELVALKDAQLVKIIDDEDILAAIREARAIASHGASRRQKQYIARLLREVDVAPIRSKVDKIAGHHASEKAVFKRTELLREQLLAGDKIAHDSLEQSIGQADAQHIRKECARYHASRDARLRKSISRQIFRELQDKLLAAPLSDNGKSA